MATRASDRETRAPEQGAGRSAGKRRAIVEAATQVFLRDGYRGTSMDEIAARAAVSKQTVYKHFADKQRLFTEIILAAVGRVDERFQTVAHGLQDGDDLEQDLREFAHRCVVSLLDPEVMRLRRLVIAEADRFPELGRTWFEQGFEAGLATMASGFEQLARRGRLRLDDPRTAASHFAGLILWVPLNQAMFHGDQRIAEADLERRVDDGVRVFLAAYGRP
jgi:TetR/AcrR family transcriptional regulator, mexJK operon transcriptional repressor